MSNYLKKTLFTLLILMMPYMNSLLKAMDDGEYERSSVCARQVSLVTEDRQDVSSSVKQSTFSQVESSEDSQTSWTSYLISPAKSVVNNVYDVMTYATQSPQKAMVVGMIYACNLITMVGAMDSQICGCRCIMTSVGHNSLACPPGSPWEYMGNSTLFDCVKSANYLGRTFCSCK